MSDPMIQSLLARRDDAFGGSFHDGPWWTMHLDIRVSCFMFDRHVESSISRALGWGGKRDQLVCRQEHSKKSREYIWQLVGILYVKWSS